MPKHAGILWATRRPGWRLHTFLHHDLDGNVAILHRTRDKMRFTGTIDGIGVDQHYNTPQNFRGNRRCMALPLERECFDWLNEASELIRPEQHFRFRPQTADREIWDACVLYNEYELPRAGLERGTILDVGGHVGSFAHAALRRGAKKVVTLEPVPESFQLLQHNVSGRWGEHCTAIQGACWRSDGGPLPPACLSPHDPVNTGSWTVLLDREGLHVDCYPLDDLIEEYGPCRLLKLDCEGSEYPILYTSKRFAEIPDIRGEYHGVGMPAPWAVTPDRPAHLGFGLVAFLTEAGYEVRTRAFSDVHGLFWAVRPAC